MVDDVRAPRSWIGHVRVLLLLAGWGAGIAGTAYAINGATVPPFAPVKVPVTLTDGVGAVDLVVPGASDGYYGLAGGHAFTLFADIGASRLEQVLARSDTLILGLGVLAGAHLLAPVLRSIAEGRPFAGRSSRRIAALAGVIAVCGVAGPMVAQWQGQVALARLGFDQLRTADGVPYFVAGFTPSPAPLLVAAVVLALAAAFRAGERLASDVEGLV